MSGNDGTEIDATAAALLGQLAWREQSAYELTKAMARNVRFFWPRADSHVYREAKKLVGEGLARGREGATGRRRRTVYSITAAGRRALADWLAQPPGGVSLEHEPLLRVFLATSGTRGDALGSVRAARAQAEAMLAIAAEIAEEYAAGRHEFQAEVHIRQFTYDYLVGWARHTVAWADRTEAELARWRDLRGGGAKARRALQRIAALRPESPTG